MICQASPTSDSVEEPRPLAPLDRTPSVQSGDR